MSMVINLLMLTFSFLHADLKEKIMQEAVDPVIILFGFACPKYYRLPVRHHQTVFRNIQRT